VTSHTIPSGVTLELTTSGLVGIDRTVQRKAHWGSGADAGAGAATGFGSGETLGTAAELAPGGRGVNAVEAAGAQLTNKPAAVNEPLT
jgi:hypothetical protein